MKALLKAPRVPCGSCLYRTDVPSGIWEKHEYDKLLNYDGPTWGQSPAIFMCHQQDGCLCGGWLACHDPQQLLALRLHRGIEPSVFRYRTSVCVFASGAAAAAHGTRDIRAPQGRAAKMIVGLVRKKSALTRPHREEESK